jgi:hypothetical protein
MTYGWADQILQPLMGVSTTRTSSQRNGKDTDDFVASLHGARHGALWWRRRSRSQ